jgi:hypothetical protein
VRSAAPSAARRAAEPCSLQHEDPPRASPSPAPPRLVRHEKDIGPRLVAAAVVVLTLG